MIIVPLLLATEHVGLPYINHWHFRELMLCRSEHIKFQDLKYTAVSYSI